MNPRARLKRDRPLGHRSLMMELLVHFRCDTSKKNTSPEIERPGGVRRAEVTSKEERPNQGGRHLIPRANDACLCSNARGRNGSLRQELAAGVRRLLVAQKVAESLSAKYIKIALATFRKFDDSFG